MDRIRVPWFGAPSWSPGPHVRLLREEELPPEVLADARLRRDYRTCLGIRIGVLVQP